VDLSGGKGKGKGKGKDKGKAKDKDKEETAAKEPIPEEETAAKKRRSKRSGSEFQVIGSLRGGQSRATLRHRWQGRIWEELAIECRAL
jgi:hypothetical protein